MKKLNCLTALILMICVSSCKKDNITKPVPQSSKTQVSSRSGAYDYQQAIVAKRTVTIN